MIIKNAIIHTVENGTYSGYDLRIDSGKITHIRKVLRVQPREEIYDAEGLHLYPGFIDANCHIGTKDSDLGSQKISNMQDLIVPNLRCIDSINHKDDAFTNALYGGVTTACISSNEEHLLGEQFAILKLYGNRVDDMILNEYAAIKLYFPENIRYANNIENSRMHYVAIIRDTFIKARDYMYKKELAGDDLFKKPEYNMKYEALIPVLKKKIPIKAYAKRTDDIFCAIRIAKEFNLKLILDNCPESHFIADLLVSDEYPVLIAPSFLSKSQTNDIDIGFDAPSHLIKEGVKVGIITAGLSFPLPYLSICASLAIKAGLSEDDALRAITINPAEILGIDNRVGSIEIGKDADLVLWDSNPLTQNAKVQAIFIDGKQIMDKGKLLQ